MRRNTPNDDRKDTISIAFRVNTGIPSEYLNNLDSQTEPKSSLKLALPTRPKTIPTAPTSINHWTLGSRSLTGAQFLDARKRYAGS